MDVDDQCCNFRVEEDPDEHKKAGYRSTSSKRRGPGYRGPAISNDAKKPDQDPLRNDTDPQHCCAQGL